MLSACDSSVASRETDTTAQVMNVHANRMTLQTKDNILFANLGSYPGDLRKRTAIGETVTLVHHQGHNSDFDEIRLQDGSHITLASQ